MVLRRCCCLDKGVPWGEIALGWWGDGEKGISLCQKCQEEVNGCWSCCCLPLQCGCVLLQGLSILTLHPWLPFSPPHNTCYAWKIQFLLTGVGMVTPLPAPGIWAPCNTGVWKSPTPPSPLEWGCCLTEGYPVVSLPVFNFLLSWGTS